MIAFVRIASGMKRGRGSFQGGTAEKDSRPLFTSLDPFSPLYGRR